MLETASADINIGQKITSVPYSAIDRFEPGFLDAWLTRVNDLTHHTQFVGGKWVQNLEKRLATAAKTAFARVCGNGTDAIQLALRALDIGPGDVVLIPDSTFWATFEAVCNVGASPVTVDVSIDDLHVTADLVKKAIQEFSPKAMILVHLYGWAACETNEIRALCVKEGVALIEDSAQSWGTLLDGQPIFAEAYISTTSFYPGKVLGAAGDGGAVFTNNPILAEKVQLLANHGRFSKYEHHLIGWNSRLDVLQAAYLDLCLDHIDQRIQSRQKVASWYRNHIQNPSLTFCSPDLSVTENGYISVAFIDPKRRETLMKGLEEAKIGYGVVYPLPISKQPGAKGWLKGSLSYGFTQQICDSIINLPCFAGMQEEELEYVQYHINRILK